MTKDWRRVLIHILSVLPALWLFWQMSLWYRFLPHDLSANPIEYITKFTGDWTIRFLLITLSVSPITKFTGWRILKYRRAVGLYAFFYALLHFLNYMVLDYFFDWPLILEDIFKRPAITFGMVAFTLLIPLAITSFKFFIKKMAKNWQKLHQLIYIITIFAVIHNYMMVKADVLIPVIHAIILASLLCMRVYLKYNNRKASIKKQLA
ncbi:MAG: sulfoxide reductase heme-binding subunit YedZ [Alphaproteobacteria bacterium]|nr:sulfoxide reductase heme-binding subunit YedZ [Alphaproteobacteria bacterium]HPF47460.1 protein-methionine-sulfoxide reductase heme-binding subunit MsrQ [Emcibacteraceae bacterium]